MKVIKSEAEKTVIRAEAALKKAHKNFVLVNRTGDASAVEAAAAARSEAREVFMAAERANGWSGDGLGAVTRPTDFGGTVTARD